MLRTSDGAVSYGGGQPIQAPRRLSRRPGPTGKRTPGQDCPPLRSIQRVNLSSAPRSMDRRANTLTTQPKGRVPVLMPGIRRHTSLEHMGRTGFVPDRIPITRAWSWIAPWVEAFIDQLATFPNAAHDDQVDAFSQALNRMSLVKIAPKVVLPLPPVPGGDRGWMT